MLLHVLQFIEVEAVISCTYMAAWFISVVGRYCTCVVGRLLFNADICERSPTENTVMQFIKRVYAYNVLLQIWNYEIQKAKTLQLDKIWAF